MKRSAILLFLPFIIFCLTGFSQKAKVLKGENPTYLDKTYKFKVSSPGEEWSIIVNPPQKDKPLYLGIRNNKYVYLSINLSVQKSKFSNLDEYIESIKQKVRAFNPDSMNEEMAYFKDIEAVILRSTFKGSYNIGYYFLKKPLQYSIVFGGSKDMVEKYRGDFDKVIQSIEFIK